MQVLGHEMSRGVNLGFPCEAFICIIESEKKKIGLVDAIQMGGRGFRDQNQIRAHCHKIGAEVDYRTALQNMTRVDN